MAKIQKGKVKIGDEDVRYINCSGLLGATDEERRKVGQAILDWLDEGKKEEVVGGG